MTLAPLAGTKTDASGCDWAEEDGLELPADWSELSEGG